MTLKKIKITTTNAWNMRSMNSGIRGIGGTTVIIESL